MELDGNVYPLDQTSGDWIMLKEPMDHPPTTAVIVMEIDGRRHESQVVLPDGIVKDLAFTPIRDVSETLPVSAGAMRYVS